MVFGKGIVKFLGHIIGHGYVKPIAAKVQRIVECDPSKDKKALMRFLRMAGFYRRFCPRYSDIATPLTNLLAKKVKFIWSKQCQLAFSQIKNLLLSSVVLKSRDHSKPFSLCCDAS